MTVWLSTFTKYKIKNSGKSIKVGELRGLPEFFYHISKVVRTIVSYRFKKILVYHHSFFLIFNKKTFRLKIRKVNV